jgi:hypothetical protein
MLNDDAIRAVRPSTKPRKLFDEKGLYLCVMPAGGRLWRFKYYFPPGGRGNKEKLISLGTYPEVSLAQARERRDAARQDVANGIDPSLRRTCEKICLGNTFESVAREKCGKRTPSPVSPSSRMLRLRANGHALPDPPAPQSVPRLWLFARRRAVRHR